LGEAVKLDLLDEVLPGGLRFGANYLVEFEPQSLWNETTLTLCAQALRKGIKTDYHTFTRPPFEVRKLLQGLGLDIAKLEEDDTFRIWDSYTVQTGLGDAEKIGKAQPREEINLRSVKMADWDEGVVQDFKTEVQDVEKHRLHIDDNTSVLFQFNDEKSVVEHFRTMTIPYARRIESAILHSMTLGTYSESTYKQFESFCDGIIDFKSTEEGGKVNQFFRVRLMRGREHDSSWRRLRLSGNGEVVSVDAGRTEEDQAAGFLAGRDEISLGKFAVIGNYLRHQDSTRNLLKDLRQKLVAAFDSAVPKHENYLVWAPPGSGKTSFIRQVGSNLGVGVTYEEVNLAEASEGEFRRALADNLKGGPSFSFVDEVDSRANEAWPLEALLKSMDAEAEGSRRVFVLAGSTGQNIDEMKRMIASRHKGKDVLSRIPSGNEYSIPGLDEIDNILVFLSTIGEATQRLGKRIREVEKLGLYYVATSEELGNPRKLREFALRCAERVPRGEERLKYDNMFDAGDPANKEFWMTSSQRLPGFVNSFLDVEYPAAADGVEAERRLAAIMFTDTVGSTALAQKNESLAMELMGEQRRIVRSLLSKNKGREVKTMGDGFLVEFPSALDAVKCAVAIQSALKDENARRDEERKLRVRIGIHLGDVIHTGTDVAGDAVNIASRIEPLASPGGICITGQVYSSVINKMDFEFERIGTPKLKGVTSPVEAFSVVGFGEGERTQVQAQSTAAGRVAVLPFANISVERSDEYFADGLTEELISSVSKTEGLRVIARTSVMKYKGANKPVSEIGRELNVASVLEGSVRKAGDKVRITVQLVDASNEEPKWSQEYDRDLKDIFAIQSDIAQRVAEALRTHVLGEQKAQPTVSTEAYVSYLRGRQAWNGRTEESLKRAVGFFEQALGADGKYAKAFTGLADSYATLGFLEFVAPNEAYPRAKEAVGMALALDPGLAEAHTSLGMIKFEYDWDWKGAEVEFKEAIAINPGYAPAHQFYSDFLKAMGRFDEAIAEIQKAKDLDPLSLVINTAMGHVLYLSRQYDRAIEQYAKTVELDPNFMVTHIWFGRPYLQKGMYAEAISELETAVKLSGESTVALAMLGHGLASAGRTEEAEMILDKLKQRAKIQYVASYWIAVIYNGFRDRHQVIDWLKRAYKERSSWLVWCNVEPRFDWLREDPEFVSLMAAMKFP